MSKATTSGMGKGGLLLRLILSILLVFSLLGTVGSAVGVSVLCGPSQLISQMHRHDAGQKVYDSLIPSSRTTITPPLSRQRYTWAPSPWTGWNSAWRTR